MQDKLLHSGMEIMFSVALVCLFVRPVARIFERGGSFVWIVDQCKRETLDPFLIFFA